MFKSVRRVTLALALALGAAGVLIWHDTLPGGWTLRGWVKPHAERRAEEQAAYSARRVARFELQNRSARGGAVLWLGSSTIERFPLEELLPGHEHLERGIGDESAAELLVRLERSLPDAQPRLAVLYVGSIDLRRLGRTPARIASFTQDVIRRLRKRYAVPLPAIVLGLLPEQDMSAQLGRRLRATNLALEQLCAADEGLVFVDPNRPPIALADGGLNPDLAADRLHLNDQGYAQLAAWLAETRLFD